LRISVPSHFRRHLGELAPDIQVNWYSSASDFIASSADAEAIWLSRDVDEASIEAALRRFERLRWVTTEATGVEWIPFEILNQRRIRLTNGAGLRAIPISEYVLMAVLAAAKNLPALVHAQDRAEWLPAPPARVELQGSRMLVIGYGLIGRAIAARARAFGVEVTGVRRRQGDEADLLGPDQWQPRLGEFQWIVLAVPLTSRTGHLIGTRELAAMRGDAWIFNIARGGLIDQTALESALESGQIAGAYLDVTDPEPLPAASRLWSMPNVLISPHSSWASTHADERTVSLFLENLDRYRSGTALRNQVDLDAGY